MEDLSKPVPVFMDTMTAENLCGKAILSEDRERITMTLDTRQVLSHIPDDKLDRAVIMGFYVSLAYKLAEEGPGGR